MNTKKFKTFCLLYIHIVFRLQSDSIPVTSANSHDEKHSLNFLSQSRMRDYRLTVMRLLLQALIVHGAFAVPLCTTNRHVHMSTLSDASQSAIITFSSLPCDIQDQTLWGRNHDTKVYQTSTTKQGALLLGMNRLKLDSVVLTDVVMRYNTTIIPKKNSSPFIYWSEYYHHVIIHDLLPNTTYYYQCILTEPTSNRQRTPINTTVNDETEQELVQRLRFLIKDSNNIHSFHTSPAPGPDVITKVAIIADVGVFQHSKDTLIILEKHMSTIDSIFLLGDISYANSDHRIWDDWFTMMDERAFLRNKPLYIVAGNHDVEGNLQTGEMFTAFEARFLMPQAAAPLIGKVSKPRDVDLNLMYQLPYEYGNSYYSFVYGSSYNIVLNSYADFEPGSRQYNWLVGELEHKVDRSITPWLVIMMHCPMYNTFSFHQADPQLTNARRFLEPLFLQYRVNFVLSGHLHAYMRSKPVFNETLDRRGPVHLIIGMGGRQANVPYKNDSAEHWVAMRDHTW
jgi:predicted phosphodiesterase